MSITPKLGAFIGVVGDPIAQTQLASFTAAMGQAPQLLDGYMDQNQVTWSSYAGYAQYMVGNAQLDPAAAAIPFCLGMPMKTIADSSADQAFKDIASGSHDAAINGVFQAFATKYSTLYIRPGWEMNGNWEPWSVTQANLADFLAAFRHIADLAHAFTGMTVKVDWSPNMASAGQFPVEYQDLYPGDQYVDVISIDQYGAAVSGSDTAVFNTTGYSVTTAAQMAIAHNKPLGIDETGAASTDTMFPANLAQAIANVPGVQVDHVNIWDDPNGGNSSLYWSDNATTSAAWQQAFGSIAGSGPPPPVDNHTLALILSEDRFKGDAQFIAKVDGVQIAGPTSVTAQHNKGQTQEFDFTKAWAAGTHDVEIDFINDTKAGKNDRNLYVEAVKYDGVSAAGAPIALLTNQAVHFIVGS